MASAADAASSNVRCVQDVTFSSRSNCGASVRPSPSAREEEEARARHPSHRHTHTRLHPVQLRLHRRRRRVINRRAAAAAVCVYTHFTMAGAGAMLSPRKSETERTPPVKCNNINGATTTADAAAAAANVLRVVGADGRTDGDGGKTELAHCVLFRN